MAWTDKGIETSFAMTSLKYAEAAMNHRVIDQKYLWEILVPTMKRVVVGHPYFTTRYHRVWDAKVRAITGGLTIMAPVKGEWVSEDQELFRERMIPVRIVATRPQINEIIEMTLVYYDQLAVLCYKLSDEVILKERT